MVHRNLQNRVDESPRQGQGEDESIEASLPMNSLVSVDTDLRRGVC